MCKMATVLQNDLVSIQVMHGARATVPPVGDRTSRHTGLVLEWLRPFLKQHPINTQMGYRLEH